MKIRVTEEDIVNGIPGDCQHCPVALALMRLLHPEDSYFTVGLAIIILIGPDGRSKARFDNPKSVTEFVWRFDNGKPASPFEFDLNVT